jgi:hypothetical protein
MEELVEYKAKCFDEFYVLPNANDLNFDKIYAKQFEKKYFDIH